MPKPAARLVAAAAALAGCAAPEPAQGSASMIAFLCEDGRYFSVEYVDGQARIFTVAGSYLLTERPSSIGRKFSSGTAAFIHDEERAALNGLPGGPFRRCRQLDAQSTSALPPLPEAIEIEDVGHGQERIEPEQVDEPT